jgi:hypothetical protein
MYLNPPTRTSLPRIQISSCSHPDTTSMNASPRANEPKRQTTSKRTKTSNHKRTHSTTEKYKREREREREISKKGYTSEQIAVNRGYLQSVRKHTVPTLDRRLARYPTLTSFPTSHRTQAHTTEQSMPAPQTRDANGGYLLTRI